MSPTRPERGDDSGQATAPPARSPVAPRETPVSGPAEVEARIELHLAQCRRRHSVLALLSISVETITAVDGALTPDLERRAREEVAHRIGHNVRGSDTILRESDRDTCVLLPGGDSAVARRVAARLARVLAGDYRIADDLLRVGVRIGTAAQPRDGLRAPELLRRAGGRD